MANVDITVTPMTASSVKRSLSLVCGNTDDMASAADAPQMATAPPVSKPCSRVAPSQRASSTPIKMVSATAAATVKAVSIPSLATCPNVMRAPSSATPQRSTVRPQKLMPLAAFGWLLKK